MLRSAYRRPGCKHTPRPRWSMRLPRSAAPAGPKAGSAQTPPADARRRPSVDVELVALGVPQRDRVVVKALLEFLAQVAEQRGAEVTQPPGLGVHALLAGLDREVPPAAGVDVEVEAVADGLAVGHDLDPDARSGAIRIDDGVRAPAEPGLGQPDVAPPVVPGDKAGRRRFQHVAQGLGPEAGQRLGVADAVDDELVPDSHGSPLVRPRPRRTARQVCRGPTTVRSDRSGTGSQEGGRAAARSPTPVVRGRQVARNHFTGPDRAACIAAIAPGQGG